MVTLKLVKATFYEYRMRVLQTLFMEHGNMSESELSNAERHYIKECWSKDVPNDLCAADIGQGKVY